MSRFHVYAMLAALVALPAAAQTPSTTCDLQVAMKCTPSTASTSCTATTYNLGSAACTGQFITGLVAIGTGSSVTGVTNSLGVAPCIPSGSIPGFPANESYVLCVGDSSLAAQSSFTTSGTATGATIIYGITVVESGSGTAGFGYDIYGVSGPTCEPVIGTNASSVYVNQQYKISWKPVSDPNAQYVLDESTTGDFSNPANYTEFPPASALFQTFTKSAPGPYTYQVKPTTCAAGTPTPSLPITVKVVVQDASSTSATSPQGSTTPINITVHVPCASNNATFTASTDKPYITVTPSSGSVGTGGTDLTATVTPGSLPPGTNTGTVSVTSDCTGTAKTTNTPIQVSIVTPVQASPKDLPPPNALVIPIVTHVNAAAGPFVSDIRLTNAGSTPASYLVTIAPSNPDGTTLTSQSTTINVEPQGTAALNDIVKNFFGFGATGAQTDTGFGSLQIRPIDTLAAFTFAASRTYTTQSIGTFGQFVAAIPFSKFATLLTPPPVPGSTPAPATTKLSLQQVSHDLGGRFRTNFGLAEGAGQPAHVVVRVYDDNGHVAGSQEYDLAPGEVRQPSLGSIVPTITDGRVEVEITSQTGAVTAYASVLDNHTTDPYAVAPVDVSQIAATRYVLPGISEVNASSNFHSDARIFNGGTSDVTATLSFSPIAGLPGASSKTLTIPAGHIAKLDNILPNFFGVSGTGGSVVVTTPTPSSLVTTANTYTNAGNGTYGQFIPGIASTDGTGPGERGQQILQLEESDQFHSNVGVSEITGNPATVTISLNLPDSKVTPSFTDTLGPNEFKQYNSVIKTFLGVAGQAYNARVTVQVTGQTGRVAAYGSVIDNQSHDPTYVPAQ